MITLTQMAASTQPIQFSIAASDDEGNVLNPTSYAVAVAFAAITSPPAAFNANTATWNTAEWSTQPGNPNPVYWVNVTPGPGGIAVTAGAYLAYTQIAAPAGDVILPSAFVIFTDS